ncbi:uncharacterized protein MONOS_12344 [Monocercomonoides exilis]|uniref:uncharacterized protein n=1 Tax=Monocercomonoides exilis TaxID=2049356 RepID=UPI00355A9AA4|nr:hypothetical protein MONOS_12344 [Monocercomonoides exilis]|eukprot:MONOS_12344.1-p1 / transcript=MONOS_12344.1 / gene=MONOS_12344 / organism=Monocercomonoides_exilis_PA203 / gene_product=unspecified product / transcript_product=unspecified product / location=Mono_scaffold00678:26899-27663(-) / protein_length=190 / sequence_SO=supercontig / SO=protein_coding / is_pseudo=false
MVRRGAGVLIDKYLGVPIEYDEGNFVEVEMGVGVSEGKEGLVDLGGDGGASEKEFLSPEYMIQDEVEVEDAFGQVRLRLLAVEEHHCNSALGRLFAHITGKPKPARVDGQIATRELLGSQDEETERNSSQAEVDAETDTIRMKRRGFSGSETHTLLPLPQSFMKKVFVESAWNKSSATKGEEHQVRISG